MKKNSAKKLESMYYDLLEERSRLQNVLEKNTERMKQIEVYLQSIYEKEDSDFKVFSPRNVESVFKERIDQNKIEKEEVEAANKELYRKIAVLDSYIAALAEALPPTKKSENTDTDQILENSIVQGINASARVSLDERLNILSIQEEERQRIARDLHDSSLQNLTHLVHKIELSGLYMDTDPVRAKLELTNISKSLKSILEDIRNTIFDIRPMSFDDLGFTETIQKMCDSFKASSDMNVIADVDDLSIHNDVILMTIYRMLHECCMNAVKHSEGSEVTVMVRNLPSMIKLIVKDNGKGFILSDVKGKRDHHYGLTILNERVKLLNGKLKIDSIPEEGTTIIIQIPHPSE